MLNYIVIMGRLVKDPELRRTGNGTAVTSFTLAVDRDFSPKDGGEKEVDFIECVAWKGTAEFVDKNFHKGKMAVVSGRLQIRPWTDKDGNKRRTAEIVVSNVYFADSKRDDGVGIGGEYTGTDSGYQRDNTPSNVAPTFPGAFTMLDDDSQLPF